MTIKLIIGLSNPGVEYSITRHNVGSWYITMLAQYLQSSLHKEDKFFGYTTYVNLFNQKIHLLIPYTSINLSGKSATAMSAFYHISPHEILVAHDELDLLPGVAKFKFGCHYSNHNGLRDIANKLGDNYNFYCLRIGIGHPDNKSQVINFVLSEPSVSEKKLIDKAINEAVYCTEIWFKYGLTKAMNRLHAFKAQ